jgi:hypothetical protein
MVFELFKCREKKVGIFHEKLRSRPYFAILGNNIALWAL